MDPLGWHVTLRLRRDRVLLLSPEEHRLFARVVLEQAREAGLLAFNSPDTHGHLLLVTDRATAGDVVRDVEDALQKRLDLGGPFDRARLQPVEDQRHLRNAFHYVLRQQERHGVCPDPSREASNLGDLLGLRPLGAWTTANVRRWLPRVDRGALLKHLGQEDLVPVPWVEDLDLLTQATLAAAALPKLAGRSVEVVRARAAAARVAAPSLPRPALAAALGTSVRSLHRAARRSPPEALVRAIRLQAFVRRDPSEAGFGSSALAG